MLVSQNHVLKVTNNLLYNFYFTFSNVNDKFYRMLETDFLFFIFFKSKHKAMLMPIKQITSKSG
jgi:hypothetical protein